MTATSKGRVYVGMSGGVDSSVTAALLKEQGYEVIGVFMKVWQPDFLPCTWEEERLDAIRVAAHLGVPLKTWDFEKEYREEVFEYMIREYKAGRTPNPDVMCNREIKFGVFFRRAMEEGADVVATGHYAQCVYNEHTDKHELHKGNDLAKDQSYFLWTLGEKELSRTLFPVGGFQKTKVRKLAKKFKIPVADKKDSQGLCFVGKLNMKDFLAHYIPEKEGEVITEEGEVIGTHRGVAFYTLGERRGFLITKKTPEELPYYIVAKDLKRNTLTVAHKKKEENTSEYITISDCLFRRPPETDKEYTAQVRYHGELLSSRVECLEGNRARVIFSHPVVVDQGQSIVLYEGTECIGGGVRE